MGRNETEGGVRVSSAGLVLPVVESAVLQEVREGSVPRPHLADEDIAILVLRRR